jgi:hypothetical protein
MSNKNKDKFTLLLSTIIKTVLLKTRENYILNKWSSPQLFSSLSFFTEAQFLQSQMNSDENEVQ